MVTQRLNQAWQNAPVSPESVEQLRAENAALRRRVVELETGGAVARAPTPLTAEQSSSCFVSGELLAQSRALLFAIVGNLPSVVFVKDVSGRYALVNQPFIELFDKDHADVFGKTDYDLFPAEVATRIREKDEEILADGRPLEYEGTIPTPRGARIFRTLKFVVYGEGGKPLGVAGISHDISDVRRLEAERDTMYSRVIESQAAMLRDLEAPLVPITRGVLIMPLVGALTEDRLRRIEETLLAGAAERRATFVILDLTGARMASSDLLSWLPQIVRSARLLGTRVLVTGLSPAMAQEVVAEQIHLDDLVALGTVENAIAHVLARRPGPPLRRAL